MKLKKNSLVRSILSQKKISELSDVSCRDKLILKIVNRPNFYICVYFSLTNIIVFLRNLVQK